MLWFVCPWKRKSEDQKYISCIYRPKVYFFEDKYGYGYKLASVSSPSSDYLRMLLYIIWYICLILHSYNRYDAKKKVVFMQIKRYDIETFIFVENQYTNKK